MSIRVSLRHETYYRYARPVTLGPQIVRLRPVPHCRTPIVSYSLDVQPSGHFLNWQQDVHGNYQARLVFPDKVDQLRVTVGLQADMTVINPFDFFLEPEASDYPFQYPAASLGDLQPYLAVEPMGPLLQEYFAGLDQRPRRLIDFLVELNQDLQQHIDYVIRLEPGVQTCEETLRLRRGSCRDTSWLLVQLLRRSGFAARFASGYLIQLKPDVKPLEGPEGAAADFCDLHAWAEAYLPGAGWIGLDPTSGLLAGEGHLPLACTPHPQSAAPISGMVEDCESEFSFAMSVSRIHEDPRVTKPYTEEQWQAIDQVGQRVDEQLQQHDVRLTMGGEPTFVSMDDMEDEQWQTAALGDDKRRLANDVLLKLKQRFGAEGLLHMGQGKWYPGEPLPRWAFRCYWRRDGQPLWSHPELFAEDGRDHGHTIDDARRLLCEIANRLHVGRDHVIAAYEDAMYYMWRERRLPANCHPLRSHLEDERERLRIARVFEQGLNAPVGVLLPLIGDDHSPTAWRSGPWVVRSDELFLLPGDSPMGLRLPLQSLRYEPAPAYDVTHFPVDPWQGDAQDLPDRDWLTRQAHTPRHADPSLQTKLAAVGESREPGWLGEGAGVWPGAVPQAASGNGDHGDGQRDQTARRQSSVIRTALCVEPREGRLHVFFPPIERLESYLVLLAAVEQAANALELPIVIEGYFPPSDVRLNHFSVTPDPGVIEINVHPAHDWNELKEITCGVYEDARLCRLSAEKFDRDGAHTGTGGGNHVVLGGPTPADSPFLRRPDVLRSLIAYWHNHPSLSYLFSGKFIGPTSQAPRVDEGRADARYELEIAFEQIPESAECPPWLVDRIFRHLLVDGTGNTHRAEFCIDKLFSPDTASGRLGLVEFRAFEMPPHPQMSLTQQLLLRALTARFWKAPYREKLADWGTSLHDRFLLPHFLWTDFQDVLEETRMAGFAMQEAWFHPHLEFRFPKIGEFTQRGVQVELRQAIEPWYVLGEEPAGGATARYVDSSIERLQVRVQAMTETRHILLCNGRPLPLHPTGVEGEYIAGVRYRAWQPPSCLHPTIPVDEPLVFDLADVWLGLSLGGCRYYVGNPGGNNPEAFPVNAYEAESRRGARYFRMGHSAKPLKIPHERGNPDFPLTLDLRRGRKTSEPDCFLP